MIRKPKYFTATLIAITSNLLLYKFFFPILIILIVNQINRKQPQILFKYFNKKELKCTFISLQEEKENFYH